MKNKYILLIISFLFFSKFSSATVYTWSGAVDTVFAKSGNWGGPFSVANYSPYPGYPTSNDTAIIVSATNRPVLAANYDVAKLIMTSGDFDLKGFAFTTTLSAEFSGGTLANGNLIVRGTKCEFYGTTFNVTVEVEADQILLSGGTFNDRCKFTTTGVDDSYGAGGCVFNGNVKIYHHGTSHKNFVMGTRFGDAFNGYLKLYNQSNGHLRIADDDSTYFNGNVEINNAGDGLIYFGFDDGYSELALSKMMSVGDSGFVSGEMYLINFQQKGSTAQIITLTDSALIVIKACIFEGDLILESPEILCSDSQFEGTTQITKSNTNANYWGGNNIFGATTTISYLGTGGMSNEWGLAASTPNIYKGDVAFESNGNSLQVVKYSSSEFHKNVSINNSAIEFIKGVVVFKGSQLQQLNGSTTYNFEEVHIDKTSQNVVLNIPVEISNLVEFKSGNFISDSTNIITFLPNSEAHGASDNSFVSGPVKKVGDTEFEFPVGKGEFLRSLSITATANSANAFIIEYFDSPQIHGTARDTSIATISHCNYWNFQRISGSEKVGLWVPFNHIHCGLIDSASATVAFWNAEWKNLRVSNFTGNLNDGVLNTLDSLDSSNADIVIAYTKKSVALTPIDLVVNSVGTGHALANYFGLNATNTLTAESAWDNTNMSAAVALMQPSTIRYPGGATGNYWDWRKGWFIDKNYPFQNCPGLPSKYESLTPQDNGLVSFRDAMGVIGGQPLFMLNLLTSTLPYQIAMLHEAEILGMPVRQVELGNEFYRDAYKECEYNEIFPTPGDYVAKSEKWIDEIKYRFNQSAVAVLGADARNATDVRQYTWNDAIDPSVMTPSPDAVTLHAYKGTGISGGSNCSTIDYSSNYSALFGSVFDFFEGINDDEYNNYLSPFDIWITEYNLFSTNDHIIHGSWAHGMQTAAMTFAMLEREYITHVNCHTMTGNAIFSSFYNNQTGFNFSNDPDITSAFCSLPGSPLTTPYSVTSQGYAMVELGQALRFATFAKPIEFSAVGATMPSVGTGIPAIQGWSFIDDHNNEHVVVLNMSDQAVTIDLANAAISTPLMMKMVSLDDTGNPTGWIRLNRFVTNGSNANGKTDFIELDANGNAATGDVLNAEFVIYNALEIIPSFSLIHYTNFDVVSNAVTISASETEVCEGRDFYLYANTSSGATSFEWFYNGISIGTTTTPTMLTFEQGNNNYTVVATYGTSGTVASSNAVVVTQKAIQTLTVSASPNNYCAHSGTPVELTASLTGSGTNHFCWIAPDGETISSGLASQLTNIIEVAPEHSATYTVYATDGICSVKQDIIIDVIGGIDFGASPVTFCNSGSALLDPHVSTGSFQWSGSAATTSTLSVNPSTPQTYTLTVTNGSCVTTGTVDVIPVECCSTPVADINLTGTNTLHSLINDSYFSSCSCVTVLSDGTTLIDGPLTIYVQGELFIEADLQLNNVNISFAERGVLIVDSYRTLTLNGSTLTGCSNTKMWQGVLVKEKGRLVTNQLSGLECEVSKAYHGVLFERMSSGWLRRTSFKNNFIGIKSLGSPAAFMTIYNKTLGRCYFESTSTLLAPYGNIPDLNVNGTKGYTGILATDDMFLIASGTPNSPSRFTDLSNGIVATNSILNISNTRFYDMQPETEYNWLLTQGIGIYTLGIDRWTSLQLRGLSNPSNATFDNCVDGINAARSVVDVSGALLNDVERGVAVSQSWGQRVNILNNTINAATRGIDLMDMDFTGRVTIKNNTINMDHPSSANGVRGISLENFGFLSTPQLSSISCNNINLDMAEHGVFINSVNQNLPPEAIDFNINIFENTITASDNINLLDGIALVNCKNFTVIENSVIGDGNISFGNSYRFMLSPEGVIHNNFSTGTYRGFYFQNESSTKPSEFINNNMEVNARGLELDPTAFMGIQSHTANNWTGYTLGTIPYEAVSGNPTAAFNFNQTFDGINLNQFIIDDDHTIASAHYPRFVPSNSTWFDPQDGIESVPYYTGCNIYREMGSTFTELDSLIASDSITASAFQEELKEIAKIALYEKINVIAENNDINGFFSSFRNNYKLTPSGKILHLRDSVFREMNFFINDFLMCHQNDSTFHDVIYEYVENYEENDSPVLSDSSLTFLTILKKPLDSLISSFTNKISSVLSGATTLLNAITTSTTIESNLKTSYLGVFAIWGNEFDRGQLIETHTPIAAQCPEEGGPGVFVSRIVLNKLGVKTGYHDEMLCFSPERNANYVQNQNSPQSFNLEIYPNPGTGLFYVKSNEIDFTQSKMKVSDLSDREIDFNYKINSENIVELNLLDVSPGVYLITATEKLNRKKVGHSKLIVIGQ